MENAEEEQREYYKYDSRAGLQRDLRLSSPEEVLHLETVCLMSEC